MGLLLGSEQPGWYPELVLRRRLKSQVTVETWEPHKRRETMGLRNQQRSLHSSRKPQRCSCLSPGFGPVWPIPHPHSRFTSERRGTISIRITESLRLTWIHPQLLLMHSYWKGREGNSYNFLSAEYNTLSWVNCENSFI